MTREEFCQKYNLTSDQFEGKEWVKGNLTIREEFLPEGFNPKVDGNLSLPNLKIIPSWFNPVVRWDLRLPSVISFDKSFDPVVGSALKLNSLVEIPFGWKPTVFWLDLPLMTNLPEWFEPVAWRVWFNGLDEYNEKSRPENEFYSWRDGQYIEADGVLTEVIEKRDEVYHVKYFGKDKIFYLVTDGNGIFAHGKTLSEAKGDLKFKLVKRNGRNQYKSLTLESVLSFDELIVMYRIITGVCQSGVNKFIKEKKVENKPYTIGEVIALTNGERSSDMLKDYFKYD